MKKIFVLIVFLNSFGLLAQGTVEQTLEGERIEKKDFYLLFNTLDSKIKYSQEDKITEYLILDEKQLFLSKNKKFNLFIKPLNPMKYETLSEELKINDIETENRDRAIGSILAVLSPSSSISATSPDANSSLSFDKEETENEKKIAIIKNLQADDFSLLKLMVLEEEKSNQTTLLEDLSIDMLSVLEHLDNRIRYKYDDELLKVLTGFMNIEYGKDFDVDFRRFKKKYDDIIATVQTSKDKVSGVSNKLVLTKTNYIFLNIGISSALKKTESVNKSISEISSSFDELIKSLEKWKIKVDNQGGYSLLKQIAIEKGKITEIGISVKSRKISINNNKLSVNSEEIVQSKMHFKRFDRFVFEVTPGVAYVNLSFPKFVIGTNETGDNIIAKGDSEDFNNINFQVMLNMNLNVTNSAVIPFLQVGVGPSTKYPVFFTGAGLRITKDLRVSAGGAWTWINELTELSVGDIVSEQSAIDDDDNFRFTNSPKFYLGFQLKL